MAGSSKIRVVRCPKCKSLLPEFSDFSLYKCGGCGAVLEAKKREHASDAESSSLHQIAGERFINKLEKHNEVINSVSQQEGSKDGFNACTENRVLGEADVPINIFSSETDHPILEHHSTGDKMGSEIKGTKFLDDDHVSNHICRITQDKINNGFTPSKSSTQRSIGERIPHYRDSDFLDGYREEKKQSGALEGWSEGLPRSMSILTNHHRVSPDEDGIKGSASDVHLSAYGRNKLVMRHEDQNRGHWIQTWVQGKPELFRKSNELNYQVFPSHNVPRRRRERDPLIGTCNGETQNLYFSPRHPNDRLDYGESFRPPQMGLPHQYAEWSGDQALDGHFMELNPQETRTHNPITCLQCYYKYAYDSKKVANYQTESKFYDQANPVLIRQSGYNNANIRSLPKKKKKHCHPIAGGAPFIVCCKCFDILKLDSKTKMNKDKWKVRCGSCSTIISFKNRKLIASQVEDSSSFCANSSRDVSSERDTAAKKSSKVSGLKILQDSDGARDSFTKSELETSPKDRSSDTSKSDPRQRLVSIKQESQNSMQLQDDLSISRRLPLQDNPCPAPPVLRSLEQFHHISSDINKTEKVQSIMMIQEHVESVSRPVPPRDASFPTQEMVEVSFKEYLHGKPPQDLSRNARKLKAKKGVEFVWLSLVKKSFKGLVKSTMSSKDRSPKVSINGHTISDHVVKKVEILAGPILPGNYWYDLQAGFWGVMGQPCIGIIPPFIEAFNYPMQANCGGGNTGVFVNGRELHEDDLDMLVSKGLPTFKNKFYKVESSGRVFDENSGKELPGLGKLAPTVERANQGFGMQVPKSSNIHEVERFFGFG